MTTARVSLRRARQAIEREGERTVREGLFHRGRSFRRGSQRRLIRAIGGVLMAGALPLAGCIGPAPTPAIAPLPGPDEAPDLYRPWVLGQYTFQVGDVIQILSYYDAGLNQEVVVRPDGYVSLLLLGDVLVLGKTPAELQKLVEAEYNKILPASDATLSVTEIQGRAVYIGGEVRQPSLQSVKGQLTLVQGVMSAGGFRETANYEQVVLLRKQDDGAFAAYLVNVNKVLSEGSPDVYLRDRDIVYVPKTGIARFGEFIDQYVNNVVPEWVRTTFGYQFLRTDNGGGGGAVVVQ